MINRASDRLMGLLATIALTALAAAAAAAPARADTFPTLRDLTSVRADGMAGAVRGFASGNEALLVNPAAIAATVRFNLTATGMFDAPFGSRVLGIDAVDSSLNAGESFPLAGALGYYNYRSGKGSDARNGSMTALGLGVPLYPDVLFVGGSLRYLSLKGAVNTRAVTADAALMLKPAPALGLSAVGYNLVDVRSAEARRAWALGAALGRDDQFHVDFDVRFDTDAQNKARQGFLLGAEYLIGDIVMPRAGFAVDPIRGAREVTGGVSVLFSGLAVEAAYRYALKGAGRAFSLDLRVLEAFL